MRLFRWLFLTKEIKSKGGELHFRRYRIFWTPWAALYIHRIYKADSDGHMHSHPWKFFLSYVLSGGYVEQTNLIGKEYLVKTAGSIGGRWWHEYHKIAHLIPTTTTLVFTVGNEPWGYQVNGQHCDHRLYRKLKHADLLDTFSPHTDYTDLLKEDEVKVEDVKDV